ncbi:nucleoid-associated protein [Anaeromicropila populeti]|uniref:Nucleoid-associated protein n=1 Tax=Anaeromicropila populeti TaxID=37658 RepID=A0A1I6KRS7_9FIRM|nr:nucleoid-associated protein [Anaeromicropila populeti]SFR93884.1 hypothetical protein SAMN05661086_02630 [Anaeromicropila populeti]
MERDDIIIRNGIVHILDSKVGIPVLSDALLELSPDINDFIRNHIYKTISGDDAKSCHFDQDSSTVYSLLENFAEENLISVSQSIASHLYAIMNQNIDIPAADLLLVTFQVESTLHLAILKMNYKETYVHLTGCDEAMGNYNDIVKQTATLPSASGKLTESCVINLEDMSILLLEKKFDVNGEKVNYFSELFLQCHTKMSPKTKLGIVTKAVEQINKKYFDQDFEKHMETKSIIQNELAEQGYLDVETICEKIYNDAPDIKEELTEKLEKYNVHKEEVRPKNQQTIKKFEKQYLVTDSGIEINIPMEEYKNQKNVEFITNPDGTISVLIKNINQLTSK